MDFRTKCSITAIQIICLILFAISQSDSANAKDKSAHQSEFKEQQSEKGEKMDKCIAPSDSSNTAAPVFDALDIMKEGSAARKACKSEGGSVSDEELKAKRNAVGDAWLDKDGGLMLHMRRTSDGIPVDSLKKYDPGTKDYDEVWKHVGGLKPGEKKLVQPWPD